MVFVLECPLLEDETQSSGEDKKGASAFPLNS